jgi:DNA-binding transcriptional ArsR family regulator
VPEREEPADQRVARDPGPRRLTDARTIRALAHPLRASLLELLLRDGPLTATQAAEMLGDSPGNMSWHLQTLAKYGYVEEAGGGRGRARPWRLVSAGNRFGSSYGDDEAHTQAAHALERLFHDRRYEQLRRWMEQRHSFDPPWNDAGFAADSLAYVTPAELEELEAEVTTVLNRFRARTVDRAKRPAGARPVHLVAFGHPVPPTASGA